MFKLGEYPEDEARDLKIGLEKSGIRTEQRASLKPLIEEHFYKEGRLSELEGQIEDIETYQGYLDAMKRALAGGATQETFKDLFYSELDPTISGKRKLLAEALEDMFGGKSDSSQEDPSQEAKNLSGEEMAVMMDELSKAADALEFATDALCRNEIEIGKDFGTKLDDPLISIEVDPDDYDDCEELAARTSVEIVKIADVYVDELSTATSQELDEEFTESYPLEAIQLSIMGAFISFLIESSDQDKIDIEEFRDLCTLDLETEQGMLSVNGWGVAEELARALEKGGVLKVKGDKIKWRKISKARSEPE
jgi:hypothetical protein